MNSTMIRVQVDKSIERLKKNFSNLNKNQVARATFNAINRTLLKGRTLARKAVKGEYNIPQKNLDGIKNKNATPSRLEGYILASAKPIPMDAFAAKYEAPKKTIRISKKGVQKITNRARARRNAAGLSIEVHKGKRVYVEKAFMIPGSKPRVFSRGQYKSGGGSFGFVHRNKRVHKTGSDIPVKPLLSVTVHGAAVNDKVKKEIAGSLASYFDERLEHELSYQVRRMVDQ